MKRLWLIVVLFILLVSPPALTQETETEEPIPLHVCRAGQGCRTFNKDGTLGNKHVTEMTASEEVPEMEGLSVVCDGSGKCYYTNERKSSLVRNYKNRTARERQDLQDVTVEQDSDGEITINTGQELPPVTIQPDDPLFKDNDHIQAICKEMFAAKLPCTPAEHTILGTWNLRFPAYEACGAQFALNQVMVGEENIEFEETTALVAIIPSEHDEDTGEFHDYELTDLERTIQLYDVGRKTYVGEVVFLNEVNIMIELRVTTPVNLKGILFFNLYDPSEDEWCQENREFTGVRNTFPN